MGMGWPGPAGVSEKPSIIGGAPIPAALVTADRSEDLAQRARSADFPLLHKPVRPAALRALLAALARRRAAGSE